MVQSKIVWKQMSAKIGKIKECRVEMHKGEGVIEQFGKQRGWKDASHLMVH